MAIFMKKLFFFVAFLFLTSTTATALNYYISDISVSGNKHTKLPVILRELPFSVGSYTNKEGLEKKIEKAYENLNNISLFNYINISYIVDTTFNIKDAHPCSINIELEERWYYWPLVNLKLEDRNLNSWIKEMDFNRITLGVGAKIDNLWGLGHDVVVNGTFGFEKGIKFSYNNIVLDRMGRHFLGLSFHALFNRTANAISIENKPVYIKSSNDFMEERVGGNITYTFRPEVRIRHSFSLGYNYTKVNDSVLLTNKDYWGSNKNIIGKYNLGYSYAFEQRNYIVYPTEGYYIGVDGTAEASDDFDILYGKVSANVQYYHKIGKRWFWGSDLKLSASTKNKKAYIYDRAIGYAGANISGYDLYVADGQHYGILSNNIRFLVLPKKIITINWLNWLSKFNKIHFTVYGRTGFDMGYVYHNHPGPFNNLSNSFLYGANIGVDIVTYYNIVLNFSYAINKEGAGGFTIGLKSPLF